LAAKGVEFVIAAGWPKAVVRHRLEWVNTARSVDPKDPTRERER
jgi:hypothetical protein